MVILHNAYLLLILYIIEQFYKSTPKLLIYGQMFKF